MAYSQVKGINFPLPREDNLPQDAEQAFLRNYWISVEMGEVWDWAVSCSIPE